VSTLGHDEELFLDEFLRSFVDDAVGAGPNRSRAAGSWRRAQAEDRPVSSIVRLAPKSYLEDGRKGR
jgi:hypothetical protein